MKLKINPVGSNAIQVQIDGEDYSIADVIHKELLDVKRVKFAGVAPPHPLIKTLTIQVHTDGLDPKKALKEAAKMSQEKVSELLAAANQSFPDALKHSSSATGKASEEAPQESVSTS